MKPSSIFVVLAAACTALAGCEDENQKAAMATGGDPVRGKVELRAHGCGTCHTIPGVPGATALVGPPLDHMASRAYVAGTLPNTPENMRAWILHPQQIKPRNVMPDTHASDQEAQNMTAYLYTLR